MAYNTNNPIGSTDPRDLYDNAQNLDNFVNNRDLTSFNDRFGVPRKTLRGMETEFSAAQADRSTTFELSQSTRETSFSAEQVNRSDRFNTFISVSGYHLAGDYAAGITITEYNQIIRDSSGEFWRLSGSTQIPYTTTGSGLPEDDKFAPLGDAVLRQDLDGSPVIGKGALFVRGATVYVDNVETLKSLPNLYHGLVVVTKGYYQPGDGGGNHYEIVDPSTGVSDGGSFIHLTESGLLAKGLFIGNTVNIRQFGVSPSLTDNSSRLQAAIDYVLTNTGSATTTQVFSSKGGSLFVPKGTYILGSGVYTRNSAINIYGECAHSSVFKASDSFSDEALITLGSVNVLSYSPCQQLRDIGLNLNGKNKPGILFAGLRDGSLFRDIYVAGFTGTAFQSKWSESQSGEKTMNQGIHIENVHCVSGLSFSGASVYKLDGLFESTLIGCKALGFAGVNNANSIGFHVGSYLTPYRSSMGVKLINCSVGNLVSRPSFSSESIGVLIENAEYISTDGCTYEQIDGVAIQFGSSATLAADKNPQRCRSNYDRFYNPNEKIMKSIRMVGGKNSAAFAQAFSSVLENAVVIEDTATECHIFVNGTNQNPDSSMFNINGRTNILEGVNSRGRFCVSGGSIYPVNMREGMIGGSRVGLLDNTAKVCYKIPETTFYTPSVTVVLSSQDIGVYGIFRCRKGKEPTTIFAGPNLKTANTAMTGTTGTVGNVTLSCDPNDPNNLILENRRGYALAIEVSVLGAFDV